MREERSVIVCEGCGVQLAGWRIDLVLPFFLLEQADEAHVMWHLSQESEPPAEDEVHESA